MVALFGEAEKGEFRTAYFCHTVAQLSDFLGEPPPESQGLLFAVQSLLYEQNVVFFRVKEEGFSVQDYFLGLNFLKNKDYVEDLCALCLPGVGSHQIIEATTPVCHTHQSMLIVTEQDLYDFLTSNP